jgi:hypothetical protein
VTGITWQLRAKDPDVACSQKMPSSPLLGQVLMAVRPPRVFDEVLAQDPWQLEE